jgi:DNA-binding LacI/PurR family transcriptional regulator
VDVPGDIAVAGFDDVPFAELSAPALTTASHPVERIATAAAVSLLARRPGPPVTLFASELIRRRSA